MPDDEVGSLPKGGGRQSKGGCARIPEGTGQPALSARIPKAAHLQERTGSLCIPAAARQQDVTGSVCIPLTVRPRPSTGVRKPATMRQSITGAEGGLHRRFTTSMGKGNSPSRGSSSVVEELQRANAQLKQANEDLAERNAVLQAFWTQLEQQMDEDGRQFLEALATKESELRRLKDQNYEPMMQQLQMLKQKDQNKESCLDKSMCCEWEGLIQQFKEFQEEKEEELQVARRALDDLRNKLLDQRVTFTHRLAEVVQERENLLMTLAEEGREFEARQAKLMREKEDLSATLASVDKGGSGSSTASTLISGLGSSETANSGHSTLSRWTSSSGSPPQNRDLHGTPTSVPLPQGAGETPRTAAFV